MQIVFPLESEHTIVVMSCSSKASAISNVILLDNDTVSRIAVVFGNETVDCRFDLLIAVINTENNILYNIKALRFQELLLLLLTVGSEKLVDKLEGIKLNASLTSFIGIELSNAARSERTRQGIRILQTHIDILEVLEGRDAFTTQLKISLIRNTKGYVSEGLDRMGNIFTDNSLSSPRNCLLELSVVVTKHKRKTVQLPRHHHAMSACKFLHVAHELCFVCRKHRLRVGYWCQTVENFARYLLCR